MSPVSTTIRRSALSALVAALLSAALPACHVDPIAEPGEVTSIALCGAVGGTLEEVWSIDNGHGAVFTMGLSAVGDVALSGEDGSIKIWNVGREGGSLAGTALEPGGVSLAYGQQFGDGAIVGALWMAADGASVLAGDDSGLVALHDALGGVLASTVPGVDPVTAVAMSDDAGLAASADASFAGNIRFWAPDGVLGDVLPTSLWGVNALAFEPGSRLLLAAGDNYGQPSIERFDPASPSAPVATWLDQANVAGLRALAITPNGTRAVAAGGGFGQGYVLSLALADLDAAGTTALATAAGWLVPDHDPVAVALIPGSDLFLTAGAEGSLRVWDATGVQHLAVDVPAPTGIAVDATGTLVTTAGSDGILRVYACARP